MPALISTIALIAGCGSEARVEVSGVVRDRATGRTIAGARVVSTDGSTTRTDADGRFTLSLSRARRSDLRASARDHADLTESLEVHGEHTREIELGLERMELAGIDDDAREVDAVLRFLEESWVDDAMRWTRAHDAGRATDARLEPDAHEEALRVRAAIALLGGSAGAPRPPAGPHEGLACDGCHAGSPSADRALRAGVESDLDASTCTACHAGESTALLGGVRDRNGDGVPGTAARELEAAGARARAAVEAAIRRARITRCGREARSVVRLALSVTGALVDENGVLLGDCDASGTFDEGEFVVTLEALSPALADAASDLLLLEDDASHGAHNAPYAMRLARAIETTATAH